MYGWGEEDWFCLSAIETWPHAKSEPAQKTVLDPSTADGGKANSKSRF